MCMCVCLNVCVCITCRKVPGRSEDGIRTTGTEIIGSWELPKMGVGFSLEEQLNTNR